MSTTIIRIDLAGLPPARWDHYLALGRRIYAIARSRPRYIQGKTINSSSLNTSDPLPVVALDAPTVCITPGITPCGPRMHASIDNLKRVSHKPEAVHYGLAEALCTKLSSVFRRTHRIG